MESVRLNLPNTSAITVEVLGHKLQFSQDPNSKHLGTTVWDASVVFAKFLEKNSRKGRFCPSKLKGKRVLELGAGCGVAGFGMALLGCHVITTDQKEVLPLLTRNVERNTSWIMQMNPDSDSFGSIQVAELDWGNEDQIRAVCPPFDYIIGTDVVYAEHLMEPLMKTIVALSGPKTMILLGYEVRSTTVHEQMLQMWKISFEVKIVPKSKMDTMYQHPSIQLYMMGLKASSANKVIAQQNEEIKAKETKEIENEEVGSIDGPGKYDDFGGDLGEEHPVLMSFPNKNLNHWEARRYGAMAARLLSDVKIP